MLLYEYACLKPVDRLMQIVRDTADTGTSISGFAETAAEIPAPMSLIDYKENFDARTVLRNTFNIRL
jgi:hypothetical protein